MHQSVRTIDSPEFINLQPLDVNPLMSICDIKVLYIGQNRNHSYITKEVATEMSKTLRGAPIVGYYKESKEDYADHGEIVTIDDEGVHFDCRTKPYGFVAPNAEVWFQKFEDTDAFGNTIIREYLMTTGYLWTGQFEEAKLAVEGEGRPQSMELDEKTLNGSWSTDTNSGMDFFIINDAIFSKLCILGEDVEPCFEGASITPHDGAAQYSLDKDFKHTLFTMMQELKDFALEGGQKMDTVETIAEQVEEKLVEQEVETSVEEETEFAAKDDKKDETQEDKDEKKDEQSSDDSKDQSEDDADNGNSEDEKKDKPASKSTLEVELEDGTIVDEALENEEQKTEPSKEFTLLQEKYNELNTKYEALQSEYDKLVSFKNEIDNVKKDELINSFTMLSDEDKSDVIVNKMKYSYEEIEAKLSIAFARKKMNEPKQEKEDISLTYTIDNSSDDLPAWLKAVKETEENM